MDEVEPHRLILVANRTHRLVVSSGLVIVTSHTETEMALVIAQLIGSLLIPEPGQLHQEACRLVSQIHQNERTILCLFPVMLLQAQGLRIKSDASLQVCHINVEMIKSSFYHIRLFIPYIIYTIQKFSFITHNSPPALLTKRTGSFCFRHRV